MARIYQQHSICWPSHACPRHPGCPERAKSPSQQGSSRSRRSLSMSSTLISSPSAQTPISMSQSGLFGQPYLHTSPKSGDKFSLDTGLSSSVSSEIAQVPWYGAHERHCGAHQTFERTPCGIRRAARKWRQRSSNV